MTTLLINLMKVKYLKFVEVIDFPAFFHHYFI